MFYNEWNSNLVCSFGYTIILMEYFFLFKINLGLPKTLEINIENGKGNRSENSAKYM